MDRRNKPEPAYGPAAKPSDIDRRSRIIGWLAAIIAVETVIVIVHLLE